MGRLIQKDREALNELFEEQSERLRQKIKQRTAEELRVKRFILKAIMKKKGSEK